MDDRPRILVGLATYNELANLPQLLDQIVRWLPDAEILVVDDDSPDGTGAWFRSRAERDPRLHLIQRTGKLGLGTAVLEAMRFAINRDYDLFINMDADLSHDPRYLPDLVRALDEEPGPVDVVIGSRYVAGGTTVNWSRSRLWASRLTNLYVRWILRLPVHDATGAYRCYRVSRLRQLDLAQIRATGYAFFEEILWRLHHAGAMFREVPIEFRERAGGQSKLGPATAVKALGTITRLGLLGR